MEYAAGIPQNSENHTLKKGSKVGTEREFGCVNPILRVLVQIFMVLKAREMARYGV